MVRKYYSILVGLLCLSAHISCSPDSTSVEIPPSPYLIPSDSLLSCEILGTGSDASSNNMLLNWSMSTTIGITEYAVYRTDTLVNNLPFNFQLIKRFPNTAQFQFQFVDSFRVELGKEYYYQMKSFTEKSESDFSNIISYTLLEKPTILSPSQGTTTANLTPEMRWLINSSAQSFLLMVRDKNTRECMWLLATNPPSGYAVQEQSIIYGSEVPIFHVKTEVKKNLLPNTFYEWSIIHTAAFPGNANNELSLPKKGSKTIWVTFKTP